MEVLPSVLGKAGEGALEQVADFSVSFAALVKLLVGRLDAVNAKVEALEGRVDSEHSVLRHDLETLTRNIQGFSDNSEKFEEEQKSMKVYKERLLELEKTRKAELEMKKQKGAATAAATTKSPPPPTREVVKKAPDPPTKKAASSSSVVEEPPGQERPKVAAPEEEALGLVAEEPTRAVRFDGTARNGAAMARWRWAMQQIKYKSMMRHIDLSKVKIVNAKQSVGSRIQTLEDSLDEVVYKLSLYNNYNNTDGARGAGHCSSGGVMSEEAAAELGLMREEMAAFRAEAGAVSTEEALWREAQAAALEEMRAAADRARVLEGEQAAAEARSAEEAADATEALSGLATSLRALALDAAFAAAKPVLRGTSTAAHLAEFHAGLLLAMIKPSGEDDQGREGEGSSGGGGVVDALDRDTVLFKDKIDDLEAAAFCVYRLLTLGDNDAARQKDGKGGFVALAQVPRRSGKFTFEEDLRAAYAWLMAQLRRCGHPGVVALRARMSEAAAADLPTALQHIADLEEKAVAAREAQVALEAAHEAAVQRLAASDEAHAAHERNHVEVRLFADQVASAQRLADEAARAGLDLKADSQEVTEALAKVHKQVAHLQANKLNREQVEAMLTNKVDRKELEHLAAAIAAGDDDPGATFASRLQLPKFRCLSCDRPLRAPPTVAPHVAGAFDSLPPPMPPRPATLVLDDLEVASLGKGHTARDAVRDSHKNNIAANHHNAPVHLPNLLPSATSPHDGGDGVNGGDGASPLGDRPSVADL